MKCQFYYNTSTKKGKLTKQVSVDGHVDQLETQAVLIVT